MALALKWTSTRKEIRSTDVIDQGIKIYSQMDNYIWNLLYKLLEIWSEIPETLL